MITLCLVEVTEVTSCVCKPLHTGAGFLTLEAQGDGLSDAPWQAAEHCPDR
jgi:hypothetical protein